MVTVIIPVYNRPDDLRRALSSLTAQTVSDFKIIIADDASTEDVDAVVDEFSRLDITMLKSTVNRGCGANRALALNYFLTEAPTDFVMFLDSDDLLYPHAIERLTELITHNEADLIITNIHQECIKGDPHIIFAKDSRTWMHGKIYRTEFIKKNNITFPVGLKTNEDLAFNLSLYAYNPNSYLINEQFYYFRNNSASVTKNTAIRKGCFSIDYIDAIYWAYKVYEQNNTPLDQIMVANILHLYNYWQRAIAFKLLTNEYKEKVREMIRCKQISEHIINIYSRPDIKMTLDQWIKVEDSLTFFGQTYGQWLMGFFTKEEIQDLIKQSLLKES